MEPTDLTLEVLKEIRDEGRKTNTRIDETNKRLDETNARLEALREDLTRRVVESEIRTATALTALSADVRELTSFLKQTQDLRPRVTQCEQDIAAIKQRLG